MDFIESQWISLIFMDYGQLLDRFGSKTSIVCYTWQNADFAVITDPWATKNHVGMLEMHLQGS